MYRESEVQKVRDSWGVLLPETLSLLNNDFNELRGFKFYLNELCAETLFIIESENKLVFSMFSRYGLLLTIVVMNIYGLVNNQINTEFEIYILLHGLISFFFGFIFIGLVCDSIRKKKDAVRYFNDAYNRYIKVIISLNPNLKEDLKKHTSESSKGFENSWLFLIKHFKLFD